MAAHDPPQHATTSTLCCSEWSPPRAILEAELVEEGVLSDVAADVLCQLRNRAERSDRWGVAVARFGFVPFDRDDDADGYDPVPAHGPSYDPVRERIRASALTLVARDHDAATIVLELQREHVLDLHATRWQEATTACQLTALTLHAAWLQVLWSHEDGVREPAAVGWERLERLAAQLGSAWGASTGPAWPFLAALEAARIPAVPTLVAAERLAATSAGLRAFQAAALASARNAAYATPGRWRAAPSAIPHGGYRVVATR
jgi:hypothetical protein